MKKILLLAILLMFAVSINAQSFVPKTEIGITAVGSTTSAVVDLAGYKIFTVKIPSTFDGDSLTVYHSNDTTSANFNPVYDLETDAILKFKVTAGREYRFIPSEHFFYKRFIKAVSNAAAATTPDSLEWTKGTY